MKILVPVKRVVDANVKIHIKADGGGVETAQVKMSINPFDEIAVEEAIRLKEKGIAIEIIAVTLGLPAAQETLRHALAMGADRAIFVETNIELQPLAVAKLLKALVIRESPSLVMMGKQAIDSDNNQTGQMLSALLNWPQGTFISSLAIHQNQAIISREVDGGIEVLALQLPAVLTTDLRLNKPRLCALQNIMMARKKPIETLTPAELGVTDILPKIKTLSVMPPAARQPGMMVGSVGELVSKLKTEAKVL